MLCNLCTVDMGPIEVFEQSTLIYYFIYDLTCGTSNLEECFTHRVNVFWTHYFLKAKIRITCVSVANAGLLRKKNRGVMDLIGSKDVHRKREAMRME